MMCVELFAALALAAEFPFTVEPSISAPAGVVGGTGTLTVVVTNVTGRTSDATHQDDLRLHVVAHDLAASEATPANSASIALAEDYPLPYMEPGSKITLTIVVQINAKIASADVSVITQKREARSAVVTATVRVNPATSDDDPTSTSPSGPTGATDDNAATGPTTEATPEKRLQVNLGCGSNAAAKWPLVLCAWLLWRARRYIA